MASWRYLFHSIINDNYSENCFQRYLSMWNESRAATADSQKECSWHESTETVLSLRLRLSRALGLEWLTDRVPEDQWSRTGDRLETGDNWAEQDVVWHHGRPGGFNTNLWLPWGARLGNDYLKHSHATGSFGKLTQSHRVPVSKHLSAVRLTFLPAANSFPLWHPCLSYSLTSGGVVMLGTGIRY